MSEEENIFSNSESQDPYEILGLDSGASFEEIKEAKEKKVYEAGEDVLKKAKIESAYDNLLMVSLKERQLGKVSNAAVNASEREKYNKGQGVGTIGNSLLTRLRVPENTNQKDQNINLLPSLNLPSGNGLYIRISLGFLAIILLLISPDQSAQLIISLSTIGLFVSQIKRGKKPISAAGWSVVLLSIGYIIGGLLMGDSSLNSENLTYISSIKLEALPTVVLLFFGILFLE